MWFGHYAWFQWSKGWKRWTRDPGLVGTRYDGYEYFWKEMTWFEFIDIKSLNDIGFQGVMMISEEEGAKRNCQWGQILMH